MSNADDDDDDDDDDDEDTTAAKEREEDTTLEGAKPLAEQTMRLKENRTNIMVMIVGTDDENYCNNK
jgi:hypothetical protein